VTTTDAQIAAMIAYLDDHLGKFVYNEDRPNSTTSGATDCSGLNWRLFKLKAGIDIGSNTGTQCQYGKLITTSKADARVGKGMLKGDTVFYRWENRTLGWDPWDHTNFYAGGDLVYNNGGPGRGPVKQSLQHNVDNAVAVMVRRNLAPVPPKPPAPIEEFTVAQFDQIMEAIKDVNKNIASLGDKIIHGHGIVEPGPNGNPGLDNAMGQLNAIKADLEALAPKLTP
jgi:hypothetical protein